MSEPSARQLIDSRGGCKRIRDALGWKLSTINTWYRIDKMPAYRRQIVSTLSVKAPPPPKGKWQREAAQQDAAA